MAALVRYSCLLSRFDAKKMRAVAAAGKLFTQTATRTSWAAVNNQRFSQPQNLRTSSLFAKSLPMTIQPIGLRFYSHAPLTLDMVQERVLLVLRLYDKINPEKLSLQSHFTNDLGLDSLDHVEVIMAMEDEFGFEIPDSDAERLVTPGDIVQYIADKEDIFD